MSDGITDSYRDARRGELFHDFLDCLADYLKPDNQTDTNLERLKKAAASTDDVPSGLLTSKTKLIDGLDDMLAKLKENDLRVWAKLLLSAHDSYPPHPFYKLKALSPFKDKILIHSSYGIGFVKMGGEVQDFVDRLIQRKNNLKIYDADEYLIVVPDSVFDQAQVVWLGCGYYGQKGPRKARG